jgi:hypothetical protein
MVESADESPCPRPGKGLQVQIAYVIKDIIIMASNTSHNKELILMKNSRVSCTSFRDRSSDCWLCPMGCLEIEDYEIGEVRSMFVLTAKDE